MEKIEKCLIDPKWEWGKIIINGVELPQITLFHPDHGKIVCVLAKQTIHDISKGINKLL